MAALKASVGHEEEMTSALLSLTALQGHVTRATNNLSETLTLDNLTAESIAHAVDRLQKQMDKFIERQMEIVELCADEQQVAILDTKIDRIITLSDAELRNAIRIQCNISVAPPFANSVRRPTKVTFRPLDHDNVQLWTRQVEDVFDTMGIDGQLNRFTTLTTLLNDSEATVIRDLTMTDPRPHDIFDQAKQLLYARYDRPVHERLTRAIEMGGFDTDESPSQWLARFRQTRGKCTIDDLDRWALIRHMPISLHPTLDALQPPPTLEEFVKHADRLIQTVTRSNTAVNAVSSTATSDNLVSEADIHVMSSNFKRQKKMKKHQNMKQKSVCWFHERFKNEAHTCEGDWCIRYKEGISVREHKRPGNDRGEQY